MPLPVVRIKRDAFLNIITSAVETFRRECVGRVFGYKPTKNRNYYLIRNASAIQCVAYRHNTSVEENTKSGKRLDDLYKHEAPLLYHRIGDFHSHPEWGRRKGVMSLSKTDMENMKDNNLAVEILVVIARRKSGHVPWSTQDDGTVIAGTLGKYHFRVGAFSYEEITDENGKKKLSEVKLRISAPVAVKALNRVHFLPR